LVDFKLPSTIYPKLNKWLIPSQLGIQVYPQDFHSTTTVTSAAESQTQNWCLMLQTQLPDFPDIRQIQGRTKPESKNRDIL